MRNDKSLTENRKTMNGAKARPIKPGLSQTASSRRTPKLRVMSFVLMLMIPCAFAPLSQALEITFYQRGYVEGGQDAATQLTDAAVREFEKRNPGVHVDVVGVPWEKEGDLKLRTALLARRRIDIFRLPHDTLPAFLPKRENILSPVDPYLTPADRADFSSATIAAVSRDGKMMAWPLWSTVLYLVANPKILREYQITPPPLERPWTWEEFKAVLRKLNTPRPDGTRVYPFNAPAQGSIFEWSPLLFAHCGPVFIEGKAAAPDGTLPLAKDLDQALGEVAGLVREGLFAPSFGTDTQEEAWAGFLAGRTALLMTSPAFLKTLVQKNVPHLILAPPTGRLGRPITTGAVGCLAVVESGDPARVKAAHALARWLTSAEIAQAVPGWYLAPPARASVTSFYNQPAYRPLRVLLPTARYMLPPVSAGFMESILIPKLAAAALGQIAPEAAIKEIQDAARDRALR